MVVVLLLVPAPTVALVIGARIAIPSLAIVVAVVIVVSKVCLIHNIQLPH
jgi:hypothetical protein